MNDKAPVKLYEMIDDYFNFCQEYLKENKHPYIVVSLMHEFARNLYPYDFYIPNTSEEHRLDILTKVLERNIGILEKWSEIGHYRVDYETFEETYAKDDDVKIQTGSVYGKFWKQYPDNIVEEASKMLQERFDANQISFDLIKDKRVLDAGCGSGRYTCALALNGAREVIGLDYGDEGLAVGGSLVKKYNLNDKVSFQKGSLLEMPFSDNYFDFVYANGVFHHTGDIAQCTRELYRVLKKDGHSWYYIYGDGGIFWYSRKKMNSFMKQIPQSYTMDVLRLIGMPANRFIFADNWYVPIEEHTSEEKLTTLLNEIGFKNYLRLGKGRKTDLGYYAVYGNEKDKLMWGDGDLHYLLTK